MKTKNKIKANIALEANLYEADIDICVVSETHLKKVVPDANVAITNCTIYRRDREWFGMTTGQRVELLCTLEILVISRFWM